MSVKTAYSLNTSASAAAEEIKEQFGDFQSKLMIVFASSEYDQGTICSAMHQNFPDTPIIGCSTAGEITTGKMLKNGLAAMGLGDSFIEDLNIQVIEKLNTSDTLNNIDNAFDKFEAHFNQKMTELDVSKYVGLILVDGLRGAEEKIMDKIGDLTNVMFVGGSAGDNLKFKCTYVYVNGNAYTDAVVLALLKPAREFSILKTQSFKCLDKKLTVTKADESNREVLEFNNKPAAQAYAEAVGDKTENIEDHFMHNPVGLMVGDEPYVRSPQQAKDNNIVFYCSVLEGMELTLLESADIVNQTQKALKSQKGELGGISAVINFHCILRTLELEKNEQTEAYGALFKDYPTIGFSTYGEEYIGHINQTSTMLIFK